MILHIDLDAFFAAIEQRDNPQLRGKPIIVGGPVPARGVAATASYEARRYGIYSGMPLSKAMRLCPQAILVPGNFFKYEKASDQFVRICSSFTPLVEQISLDEIFLDLEGTNLLWPSSIWVAREIQARVKREIGITCSVGIASQKTVAKVASGVRKPNGVTLVPQGEEKEFLTPLSLDKLPGCGPKTQAVLRNFEIVKIGDLAKMHPEHVRLLLGQHGLYLWQVANGQDFSEVSPPQPAKSTGRSTTFPFDTRNPEFILAMLYYLSQRVAKDLRESSISGRCLTLTARSADFATFCMQETLPYPINTAHEIFQNSKLILSKLWDGYTSLRLIGVSISQFNRLNQQLHLFKPKFLGWEKIEQAMDQIRAKYGFLSIYPASIARLEGIYPVEHRGLKLATPSLSR